MRTIYFFIILINTLSLVLFIAYLNDKEIEWTDILVLFGAIFQICSLVDYHYKVTKKLKLRKNIKFLINEVLKNTFEGDVIKRDGWYHIIDYKVYKFRILKRNLIEADHEELRVKLKYDTNALEELILRTL
jgi:hypothetical protein